MFSNLGPLFKTVFRQAEQTDTRQAIRREEKEQGRRNNEAEEDNRISIDLWEDNASVSVDSLRAFLIDFLKTKSLEEKTSISDQALASAAAENDSTTSNKDPERKKPQNNYVAKAASAYQTMADKTAPSHPSETLENLSGADLVESDEVRKIYALIEDLEPLSQNGISALYIEKAESFVESLRQAVRLAKSKL